MIYLTSAEFEQILSKGENLTVEFKSWVHTKDMKERISLAVDELVAFANAKGGTVYLGVEDDGTVTGCTDYDTQKIMESIYDRTRPALFTDVEVIRYGKKDVLAIKVDQDGTTYATSDGRCLKRLGRNSKPYYPDEMSNKYTSVQSPDFSGQILSDSTVEDINVIEIYHLKEKLKMRDPQSSLPELEDMSFLRDLGLIKEDTGIDRLTVAGLLFVGKEASINRLLPQAEVIYLHYSESNMEEYDSRLDLKQPIISVIDRLTEKIQNTNKIVKLMILRYLTDHKRIMLSEAQDLTQLPAAEARKSCNDLVKSGLIELSGKEYMLTAKVYEAIKSDVEYVQDTVIRYVKAKSLIGEYLKSAEFITNEKIRELCGFTRQQARTTLDKMQSEGILRLEGKGRAARYYKNKCV